MCGIWGAIAQDQIWHGKSAQPPLFHRLAHRGPDEMRELKIGSATLAHTRLSIIDLTDGNSQPFATDRCAIVFNGEIYNFRELRDQLTAVGCNFRSQGDTEVIARGFEAWGVSIFEKLQGMYAIALYDVQYQRLYLARDRFGIKPLYWTIRNGVFLFSSEIKALSESLEFDMDDAALADLMSFGYYFNAQTVFRGVACLEAGATMEVQTSGSELRTSSAYLKSNYGAPTRCNLSAVRSVLEQSVRAHLISDVPVAVALSGGLDSSIVTALAARALPDLLAITNTWQGEGDAETRYASRLTGSLRIRHQVYKTEIAEGKELLRRLVWHLEEPIPNVAAFHSYLIGEVCKDAGIKVVLLGEGADELFAGYPWHRLATPRAFRSAGELFDQYESRRSQKATIRPFLTPEGNHILAERSKYQREVFVQNLQSAGTNPFESFLAFERKGQLQVSQLHRVDRMFMAHGVEARVPYLYDSVAQVAANLPVEEKMSESWTRRILGLRQEKVALADAFVREVPRAVLHRPKFGPRGSAHLAAQLEGTLQPVLDHILMSPEHQDGRRRLARLIDWATVRAARPPFKIRLFLAFAILCTEMFSLGGKEPTINSGTSPVRRRLISSYHRHQASSGPAEQRAS